METIKAAEIAKLTPDEYKLYIDRLKTFRDWKNSLDTAKEEGIQIGKEEGEAERATLKTEKEAAQAQLKASMENVVVNSHKKGFDIDTIVSITGLTNDEIITILKHNRLM